MSRLLVDTRALLWWLTDDEALSPLARAGIADAANEPVVSAASVWEIAIKQSLGKLAAPDDLPDAGAHRADPGRHRGRALRRLWRTAPLVTLAQGTTTPFTSAM